MLRPGVVDRDARGHGHATTSKNDMSTPPPPPPPPGTNMLRLSSWALPRVYSVPFVRPFISLSIADAYHRVHHSQFPPLADFSKAEI